ncbi:hypothetical protein GCM10010973_13030 [Cribrihabitans marinus]|nr:hypothetical protein GCM10010973_13030 [Cribrihabitans marinus]
MLAVAAPAAAQEPELVQVTYTCDRGVEVPVVFINTETGPGQAVMQIEGKLVALRAAPTGSGVRYVAVDEQDSYRLYTKGDVAIIGHLVADHTATETVLFEECTAGN